MELHGIEILAFDHSAEFAAILGDGDRFLYDRRAVGVRVLNEAAVRYAFQQTRRFPHQNAVPSYVRDFQAGIESRAGALKAAEPGRFRGFLATLKHPLQSDANSQEWPACRNGLLNRVCQLEPAQGLSRQEVTHPRQYELFCAADDSRVAGNLCRYSEMRKSLGDRSQVPGAVIDNRNHSSPLVLGNTRAKRRSLEQAKRIARANALKTASIL